MYIFSDHEIKSFHAAKPFPHIVVDNFLKNSIAEHVAETLASLPRDRWKWKTAGDGRTINKGQISDMAACDPLCWDAFLGMTMNIWQIEGLRDLTNIDGLKPDPGLPDHAEGGGFHRIDRGGRLGIHVDFNTLKDRPQWRRRLNVLVYLNREWEEEWGGHLELYGPVADGTYQPMVKVLPKFNRAVLFETSDRSWHGHPEPLACPDDKCRLSMAAYFYTDDATEKHRTTVYQ